MIDGSEKAVLCDFGLSHVKADVTSRTARVADGANILGSRNWMAPERILGGSLKKPCDIYAFGMTLFEVNQLLFLFTVWSDPHKVFTNEIPLGHIAYGDFIELVVKLDVRPERPEEAEIIAYGLSDAVWQVAEQCWKKSPGERPTADAVCDLLSHLIHTTLHAPPLKSPGVTAPMATPKISKASSNSPVSSHGNPESQGSTRDDSHSLEFTPRAPPLKSWSIPAPVAPLQIEKPPPNSLTSSDGSQENVTWDTEYSPQTTYYRPRTTSPILSPVAPPQIGKRLSKSNSLVSSRGSQESAKWDENTEFLSGSRPTQIEKPSLFSRIWAGLYRTHKRSSYGDPPSPRYSPLFNPDNSDDVSTLYDPFDNTYSPTFNPDNSGAASTSYSDPPGPRYLPLFNPDKR